MDDKARSENFLNNKFNGLLQKFLRKILIIRSHHSKNTWKRTKFNTLFSIMNFRDDKNTQPKEIVQRAIGRSSPIFKT